jgi:hypothetical protein
MGAQMGRKILAVIALLASTSPAFAGLFDWSLKTDDDPFSGGQRVTVDITTSIRSGVVIICDSAEKGLLVRAIPGFAFSSDLQSFEPQMEFAIDGQRLFGQSGHTGSVGDNTAIAETMLTEDNAKTFVQAFAKAKKQVAIKDGISDRPYLLTAQGTTKAGAALVTCMGKQAP